jgi:hypothetical protein
MTTEHLKTGQKRMNETLCNISNISQTMNGQCPYRTSMLWWFCSRLRIHTYLILGYVCIFSAILYFASLYKKSWHYCLWLSYLHVSIIYKYWYLINTNHDFISTCVVQRARDRTPIWDLRLSRRWRYKQMPIDALKMGTLRLSETMVSTYKSTWRHNPNDQHRHFEPN